jgi:hypothetical protein
MLAEPVAAQLYGHERPRIAPPVPARSGAKRFAELSAELGLELRPWQKTVARYLTAEGPDGRWLFRELALIVSRQNGKTAILLPLIVQRLLAGQRIMHTAQNRDLPREVFYLVADIMWSRYSDLFPERNGRPTKPRYANGQEEIRLTNGGIYSIVAPTRGGARGPSRDLVIVDELREMEDNDFIAAAKPTLTASPKPQMVYMSNAGTETSVVLNALKKRGSEDPAIAYLEWSAAPERPADDVKGWLESNPSYGHDPAVELTLEDEYRANRIAGTMSLFETEHLCRWVATIREPLVALEAWAGRQGEVGDATRPVMAISLDPKGARASAAIAWPRPDGSIAMRLVFDVTGSPIDTAALGKDMRAEARELGVSVVGFDPLTDAVLAKYFRKTEAIAGAKFANASAMFTGAVGSGKLVWTDAAAVGADLVWTAKKPHDESGSFQAVRADDERPITASLATIRAVWLASSPRPEPTRTTTRRQVVGF